MKYVKLALISIIVFSVILFGMSLFIPPNTIVSKAADIRGNKDSIRKILPYLFKQAFNKKDSAYREKNNAGTSDTLQFSVINNERLTGGIALYPINNDSVVLHVFYKIYTPWYKPLQKMALIMNENKYGPLLDSAMMHIKQEISKKY